MPTIHIKAYIFVIIWTRWTYNVFETTVNHDCRLLNKVDIVCFFLNWVTEDHRHNDMFITLGYRICEYLTHDVGNIKLETNEHSIYS